MRTRNTLAGAALAALVLGSCGTLQPTAGTLDGVYQKPEPRGSMAAMPPTSEADGEYYDPEQAANYEQTERGYYDVTYNDPQYYNYDRFRFNVGVNSWNGNMGWGMGMSYGWPYNGYGGMYDPFWGGIYGGMGSCWGSPYWGGGMGMGMGWGDPYWGMGMGTGWGNPYWGMGMGMGWGSPWCGMGWGYPGYGYGPYYGPMGSCYGCYTPIVYTNPVLVGHRPSVSGGSGSGGGGTVPGQPTYTGRSPVNLLHNEQMRRRPTDTAPQARPTVPAAKPQRGNPGTREVTPPARPQRTPSVAPAPGGSRGGGMSPSAPSRGGGSPSMPSRPR